MKIKEVVEKTGLTERAIRLYIDEGLSTPNIEESYSGRKNVDFSSNDVERLNQVAMLRKAGFSIADIKSIIESKESAKTIVEKFICETEANIKHESEIVEKLNNISFNEDVTIETICELLSATVAESEVPKEDLHVSLWQRIEKNTYKAVGVSGLLITGGIFVLTLFYWLNEYKHLKLTEGWFLWVLLVCLGWIAVAVLSGLIIILNRNKLEKRNKKVRRILSSVIMVCMIIIGWFSVIPTLIGALAPPAYSFTTDIEDYMVLDSWVEDSYGDEIHNLFPDEIPASALKISDEYYDEGVPFTTRYYYRFTYDLDQFVDIVAEWVLPQNEYEEEKSKACSEGKITEQKGDWVCVCYSDNPDYLSYELIFAYNDKERKVRYIASMCIGADSSPYYLTLDW